MKDKRKIFLFVFLVLFSFFIGVEKVRAEIPAIYNNPGQGIFQCHSNHLVGSGNDQEYLKGGALIIRWDWLQPVDNDHLDQTELNRLVNLIGRGGKKVYLHFQIYYPNDDPNDSTMLPDWLQRQVVTVNGGHPVPWDLVYQEKLDKFLRLFASALENRGVMNSIEYIEPAVGGRYASTDLWISPKELCNWAAAAPECNVNQSYCNTLSDQRVTSSCTDTQKNIDMWTCLGNKFNQGVNTLLEKYLTIFPDFSIIKAGGNCLCGPLCNYTGASYMLNKYGMRFTIKGAGLGHPADGSCGMAENLGAVCKYGDNMTKCGQEPYLSSQYCASPGDNYGFSSNCGYKNTFNTSLNHEKISYYCLYSQDIGCNQIEPANGETINNINRWVAERVGAQIFITNKSLDALRKNVGAPLTISVTWQNQGSAPLVAPLKQGIKWVPSSYKLFVEFVKNGVVANYQELDLNTPTQQWVTLPNSTLASTQTTFNIPTVLGGATESSENTYKVYIGLTDPNGERKRFALRNTETANDLTNRKYLLADSFTVVGANSGPTVTPGQPGSCSCSSGKPAKSLGNANCDGAIDGIDFEIWREEFNNLRTTKLSDFNCTGSVTQEDYNTWWANRVK